MCRTSNFVLYTIIISCVICNTSGATAPHPNQGQLVAVQVNATLPSPRYGTAAHFDGSDSIYIFGGFGGVNSSNQILKYNISSDNIQLVASLPVEICCGTVSSDSVGNIYYFGGYGISTIYKFSPNTTSVDMVGYLPNPNFDQAAMTDYPLSDDIYILGGYQDPRAIVHFNATTLSGVKVGNLTQDYNSMTATSDGQGSAFIFGNPPFEEVEGPFQAMAKLNLSTLETTLGPETFPTMKSRPSAVWDGRNAYIIYGYEGNLSVGIRTDSVIKFDPETMENTIVQVTDFPANRSDVFFSDTSSVYVPSLNRIYFFGGYTFYPASGVYHDQIWFIDLSS